MVRSEGSFKYLVLPILFVLAVISCSDDSISPGDTNADQNIPVVTNTQNAYTFTIDAVNYSFNEIDTLGFTTDSLVAVLTFSNYRGGNGRITLTCGCGADFYTQDLSSGKVVVDTELHGYVPKVFTIRMTNLTGQLSFVVAKKEWGSF
jgi:hypothetical protein